MCLLHETTQPTVGEACENYHKLPLKTRGLYLTLHDKGSALKKLQAWPVQEIKVAVITDGERILGLGALPNFVCILLIAKQDVVEAVSPAWLSDSTVRGYACAAQLHVPLCTWLANAMFDWVQRACGSWCMLVAPPLHPHPPRHLRTRRISLHALLAVWLGYSASSNQAHQLTCFARCVAWLQCIFEPGASAYMLRSLCGLATVHLRTRRISLHALLAVWLGYSASSTRRISLHALLAVRLGNASSWGE
jgi:hypothetical protein